MDCASGVCSTGLHPTRAQFAMGRRRTIVRNPCWERRHDLAQSVRAASGRFQGQPLGQGTVRQPLYDLQGRDGQITRLALAIEPVSGLSPSLVTPGVAACISIAASMSAMGMKAKHTELSATP